MRSSFVTAIAALLGACATTTVGDADTELEGAGLADSPPAAGSAAPATPPAESDAPGSEPPGSEPPASEPADTAEPTGDDAAELTADDEPRVRPPSELQCVSAATSKPGEVYLAVWRALLHSDGETMNGTFTRGPLFRSHLGVWDEAVPETITVDQLDVEGALRFRSQGETQVSLELSEQGLFFSGQLVLEGERTEVVCWDRLELFGSSWATQPQALPAHYDPALGDCIDRDGAPALNALPIEFVLETGYGECADLRGIRLHGDDYANPDLSLSLRGADLEGAKLNFANLAGSFEGARMAAFDFGYARISGTADAFTELHDSCELMDSPWAGKLLTCLR
jgi:hypothetical protein